jgi:hypothetical protein
MPWRVRWEALEGVTKQERILAICDRVEENKASMILNIASVNL